MSVKKQLEQFYNKKHKAGSTNKDIASELGISVSTLRRYRIGLTDPKPKIFSKIVGGDTYGEAVKKLSKGMTRQKFESEFLLSGSTLNRYKSRIDEPKGKARLPIRKTDHGYEVDEFMLDMMRKEGKIFRVKLKRDELDVWGSEYTIYEELHKTAIVSSMNPQLGLAIKNGYTIEFAIDEWDIEKEITKKFLLRISPEEYKKTFLTDSVTRITQIITDKMQNRIQELKREQLKIDSKKTETPPVYFRVSKNWDNSEERALMEDYIDKIKNQADESNDEYNEEELSVGEVPF